MAWEPAQPAPNFGVVRTTGRPLIAFVLFRPGSRVYASTQQDVPVFRRLLFPRSGLTSSVQRSMDVEEMRARTKHGSSRDTGGILAFHHIIGYSICYRSRASTSKPGSPNGKVSTAYFGLVRRQDLMPSHFPAPGAAACDSCCAARPPFRRLCSPSPPSKRASSLTKDLHKDTALTGVLLRASRQPRALRRLRQSHLPTTSSMQFPLAVRGETLRQREQETGVSTPRPGSPHGDHEGGEASRALRAPCGGLFGHCHGQGRAALARAHLISGQAPRLPRLDGPCPVLGLAAPDPDARSSRIEQNGGPPSWSCRRPPDEVLYTTHHTPHTTPSRHPTAI